MSNFGKCENVLYSNDNKSLCLLDTFVFPYICNIFDSKRLVPIRSVRDKYGKNSITRGQKKF